MPLLNCGSRLVCVDDIAEPKAPPEGPADADNASDRVAAAAVAWEFPGRGILRPCRNDRRAPLPVAPGRRSIARTMCALPSWPAVLDGGNIVSRRHLTPPGRGRCGAAAIAPGGNGNRTSGLTQERHRSFIGC
jgi:hypothetical protein